jgi:recombination protein RecA
MSDDLRSFLAKATAPIRSLDELRREASTLEPAWDLASIRGRLVELSARGATATLTAAIDLVIEAQAAGEPVAWVALGGTFYPPDVADSGVDLAALVVVRAPDAVAASRAAERVLRSGAFGLVVIDYGAAKAELPTAHQGRLVTLAQSHDAAVVCITDKTQDTASLGSLVSLRVEAIRTRGRDEFDVTIRALKDKRRGPGWTRAVKRRGPAGYG